ncbi:TonB-dependent receptor [Dysgonomonas sp. 511]|uniref:TonB-dependent receptor n=1 Tax=Dysgonomonas sp. 511 TaxID=2302930 RepID=UPI0013D614F5|nr:TonB-dependent receptor [Dysgonomonas sp. 511]NDV77505.1 TonB-dependent receptor [Dysgonomonas sp. 511]
MKTLKLLILLLILPLLAFGKDILKGYVVDQNKQPLIGASVRWEDEKTGVITDEKGYFEIAGVVHKNHMLLVSYVGFNDKSVHLHDFSHELTVVLEENNELAEVVIEKTPPGTIKSRKQLLNTEKITTKELHRAACCNLSESFETNPSVDVSFSDAVTGAKQIQLLGLAGTYVQTLTENYPNFRGSASVYGLDYVPGPWMESIQVSKGAASVKNGYESITGQMNVEYKKPDHADPLSLNVFTSDAGRYEGNADAAFALSDNVSTGLFLHYSNETATHDDNDDSFLDSPKKHQFNMMNRWHYTSGKYAGQAGFRFLQDYRTSGQTMHTLNDASVNKDNPFEISIKANRGEFYSKNSYTFDEELNSNMALIVTGSYHDQKSQYAGQRYNVYGNNLYASLMFEIEPTLEHRLSAGLSLNWDKYSQTIDLFQPITVQPDKETTSGGYLQYTFNKNDKFIALAGIRADYSTLHKKTFVTPRLHLKYMPFEWLNMRASAGKGYRTVFVMPENSFYLASSRKIEIANNLKQESAWNYGTSISFHIPIGGEELTISGEWYRTDFDNQVVTDVDSDPHKVQFYNLDGKSYANSFQVEVSYPLFKGFNILGAYRRTIAKTEYQGKLLKKPLVSDYKALATASYETPLSKWVFDLTAQFNGGGRMPAPDANNPLWKNTFGSYTIMNAQITKNFRTWSIYAGAENITDFKQKNPIVSPENPFGNDFDATMVWGPTMGRKFYVGLRYTIGK